jgi:hemerythrin superfamily protein
MAYKTFPAAGPPCKATQENFMPLDAIAMLDADHQRVESLFRDFESAGTDRTVKHDLAQVICMELTVHAQLEEEIFYPAVRQATGDDAMVDEAQEEHDEAKQLIAQIESADDADALIIELRQAIEHHVAEERQEMFAKARAASGLDLTSLAKQLEARKAELITAYQDA